MIQKTDMTRNDYYIYDAQDLYNMRNDPYGDYHIMNDIDMSDFTGWQTMYADEKNPFMGSLNGNDFTIKNLVFSDDGSGASSRICVGFIGYAVNATFQNIKIDGFEIYANEAESIGVLVGHIAFKSIHYGEITDVVRPFFHDITITNSKLSVTNYSTICGGIVGYYISSYELENVIPLDMAIFDSCLVTDTKLSIYKNGCRAFGGIVGLFRMGFFKWSE